MSIIVLLLAAYLLAIAIGCMMITIGWIIQGIVKWILLVLTALVNLFK